MASEKRSIGLFGIAGVLVAALIIAGFAFAGNILQVSGKSVLTIQITDKPVELEELLLKIDYASVQGEDGKWIDLDLELTGLFDLLALQDVTATLSVTEIPAGSYKMVKIHVKEAYAVYPEGQVPDGMINPVELKMPSSFLRVILEPALTLQPDEGGNVLIDLQPVNLDDVSISSSFNLRPVIKAAISSSD
jgi:hypothetical protein